MQQLFRGGKYTEEEAICGNFHIISILIFHLRIENLICFLSIVRKLFKGGNYLRKYFIYYSEFPMQNLHIFCIFQLQEKPCQGFRIKDQSHESWSL